MWTTHLGSNYDWKFLTEKNPSLYKGMEDERCVISRGLALGGSSSINAMIYLRGTMHDFEYWKYLGCYGWDYEDVLPYFKKSEDFVDNYRFDPEIHSQGGLLTVTPLKTFDPAYDIILEAERSLNLNMVNDFNQKILVPGFGNFDSNTRDGKRCSTLKAFLLPASNRKNLYVAKNIIVTRIIFEGKIALGVEFISLSKEYKSVFCTKEVILSAGPIKSPQILMLSGIGPKEHLQEFNISVLEDLQVGFNLQDHISLPALVFTDRKYRSKYDIMEESKNCIKEESSLYLKGISTLGLSKLMSFYKTNELLDFPDVQIIKFRIPYNSTNYCSPNKINIFTNMFGYAKEVTMKYDELNLLSDIIVMTPIIVQPLSAGNVMLKSTDPLDNPKIFANYLNHEEEKEALLKGIELIVKLSKTKEMINAGLILEKLELPNCKDYIWDTREYWLCVIENIATPFFHVVGTCRMGSIDDCKSVVDPLLRVKGITGLRVIDSSIMPKIVSVNPNAASIMIGEKGSDIIKEYYGKL